MFKTNNIRLGGTQHFQTHPNGYEFDIDADIENRAKQIGLGSELMMEVDMKFNFKYPHAYCSVTGHALLESDFAWSSLL